MGLLGQILQQINQKTVFSCFFAKLLIIILLASNCAIRTSFISEPTGGIPFEAQNTNTHHSQINVPAL